MVARVDAVGLEPPEVVVVWVGEPVVDEEEAVTGGVPHTFPTQD